MSQVSLFFSLQGEAASVAPLAGQGETPSPSRSSPFPQEPPQAISEQGIEPNLWHKGRAATAWGLALPGEKSWPPWQGLVCSQDWEKRDEGCSI